MSTDRFVRFQNAEQLALPGLPNIKHFVARSKFTVKKSLTFDQGMKLIHTQFKHNTHKTKLHFFGVRVSETHAIKRHLFKTNQNVCVSCGLVGDHFNIERHQNMPASIFNLVLYGWKDDCEVALTWDHILPVALGGADTIENAQCMCNTCNVAKGHDISISEIAAIVTNPNVDRMFKVQSASKNVGIEKLLLYVKQEFNEECNRLNPKAVMVSKKSKIRQRQRATQFAPRKQ
jgi:5-methylcytosine-specific restriction endonuclease McrA